MLQMLQLFHHPNIHARMLLRMSESKMNIMYGVLYVPYLTCNLFSVRAAAAKGNTVDLSVGLGTDKVMYGAWGYSRIRCMS